MSSLPVQAARLAKLAWSEYKDTTHHYPQAAIRNQIQCCWGETESDWTSANGHSHRRCATEPPSVCARPTVWAPDLITKSTSSTCSPAASWSASTWTGPREVGAWGEDGIKSRSPFRIDPSDGGLGDSLSKQPSGCRPLSSLSDAFGRRREGHFGTIRDAPRALETAKRRNQ